MAGLRALKIPGLSETLLIMKRVCLRGIWFRIQRGSNYFGHLCKYSLRGTLTRLSPLSFCSFLLSNDPVREILGVSLRGKAVGWGGHAVLTEPLPSWGLSRQETFPSGASADRRRSNFKSNNNLFLKGMKRGIGNGEGKKCWSRGANLFRASDGGEREICLISISHEVDLEAWGSRGEAVSPWWTNSTPHMFWLSMGCMEV